MKFFHSTTKIIIYFSAYLFLLSCNKIEDTDVYNPELVFTDAVEIRINSYQYTDLQSGITYKVEGDTITDTLSSMPDFQWETVPCSLLTAVISTEPIQSLNGTLINPEKIIWQWHSAMQEHLVDTIDIQSTRVYFREGKNVEAKNILYNTQPLPLQNGLYFWAVWGWDKSGSKVVFSSKPLKFIVE